MQLGAQRQDDPGGELHTWRTAIVPMFGPLWVLLPSCVWLVCFGSDLIAIAAGSSGWWILGTLVLLAVVGWIALAGARLMHASQRTDSVLPRSLVLRTGVILLLQMLIGAVFLLLVMYGMWKDWEPLTRAVIGACVTVLAWMGWSGITPQSRRLALGTLRWLRRRT